MGESSGRKCFFDFHFALKEQVRDAFHRQLHHLPPEFVGVVMDVQELVTLHIGPSESMVVSVPRRLIDSLSCEDLALLAGGVVPSQPPLDPTLSPQRSQPPAPVRFAR